MSAGLIAVASSCARPAASPQAKHVQAIPGSAKLEAQTQKSAGGSGRDALSMGTFTGTGGITVVQRDPKHPSKILWKLWAASASYSQPQGVMSTISAVLFDKTGHPSATLKAPLATGDSVNQKIVASRGVVYTSISPSGSPTGRSLSADTVTWNAKSDEIVATGHVLYQDKTKGITMNAPRAVSDSHLRNVRLENSDMVLNMSGSSRR